MNLDYRFLENRLIQVYTFLFIFTMFNKEFMPFGFDLRYVLVIVAIGLLLKGLLRATVYVEKRITWIKFYIWSFFCNFLWLFNGLSIDIRKFTNELILLTNVFLSILVFSEYKNYISQNALRLYIMISAVVLSFSMLVTFFGVPIDKIWGNDEYIYVYENLRADQMNYNMFGMDFRVGGYAQDPNYASILMFSALVSTFCANFRRIFKLLLCTLFIICYGLAFSKTVSIAILLGILTIGIKKIINIYVGTIRFYDYLLVFIVLFISFALFRFDSIYNIVPTTVSIRFRFWKAAEILFFRSPIFGSGLTSFRSFFSENGWYVQAHNTYWQVLSEFGLIGFVMYLKNIINSMSEAHYEYQYFQIFVFVFWIASCESIALQLSVYFILIQFIDQSYDDLKQFE